jgi:hypothetical protein
VKSQNGIKPQLTANTLANSAAENSNKTQNEQATRKPWYHWFF